MISRTQLGTIGPILSGRRLRDQWETARITDAQFVLQSEAIGKHYGVLARETARLRRSMACVASTSSKAKARMQKMTYVAAAKVVVLVTACGNEITNVPRITACTVGNIKKLSPPAVTQFKQTNEAM
jgi:hypothetical protein